MNARRRWVQLGLTGFGLLGVVPLLLFVAHQPWVKQGLLVLVVWQLAWYVVRGVMAVSIWRRETALSRGEKLWLVLTVPIYVLAAVWWSRGRLSAWVAEEEAVTDEC